MEIHVGCMTYYKKMGQDIVRRNYPEEPGKWRKLWLYKDIHNVLKNMVREHSENFSIYLILTKLISKQL